MSCYCRICGRERPNERFSGKGYKKRICKDCAKLPQETRDAIVYQDEIYQFLRQKHVSPKNVARLKEMLESADAQVQKEAQLVLQVAAIKPYRRKRIPFLSENHPDLLTALKASGLIEETGYQFREIIE
jgi:hypothetical protein